MARNLYAEVTARILAEMETGALPWVKPWSAVASSEVFPLNGATGRRYSGVNTVLLWAAQQSAGYASPRWMTFKQAQELGGNVRKGEKSSRVVFVSTIEKEDKDTGETERVGFLKEYCVFNIAQIDGLPARVTEPGAIRAPINPDARDTVADAFMRATLADIRHGEGSAYYRPAPDFVMLPDFEAFRSASSYYGTAFHELGHWTGAERRLNRDLRNRFGSEAYAAEELVAELTAAFLCAEFGFDGETRHAGYIANWIRLLQKDDRAFFTAASKAQQAADYLRGLAIAALVETEEGNASPLALAA